MQLIDNARAWWKMFSMQAYAAALALLAAWQMLPPEWQALVPPKFLMPAVMIVLVAGAVGRIVKQDGVSTEQPAATKPMPPNDE